MATVELPYFDILLGELSRGRRDISIAFGRHVHWGHWDDDHPPSGTMDDFAAAAERMSRRVCAAAPVRDGQRVLDVGCGFGGTIASLDARHRDLELVGLNIDPRQLERARREVVARPSNAVSFVEGDACAMPFPDASFDVVLALECIFHFESRDRFFDEVRRVLKPGGRLAFCDLVPSRIGEKLLPIQDLFFARYKRELQGPADLTFTRERYVELATAKGFTLAYDEDVTAATLATYPVLRHVATEAGMHVLTAAWGTACLEWMSRYGILKYIILSFEK